MKIQLFQYVMDGKIYDEGITADSEADMKNRLEAMAKGVVYAGELIKEFPANDADIEWAMDQPDIVN